MFTKNSSNNEQEENDPPSTCVFSDVKMAYSTTSSPKRRRAVQKRLVSIPIKDIQGGSRLKGETAPPSDSWAWRKYGQKPIKGSPYPRGYYRCSSSKGCPARKQVERSRSDPSMLLITYSSDHNHPWPVSRSHHHHPSAALPDPTHSTRTCQLAPKLQPHQQPDPEPDQQEQDQEEEQPIQDKFADLSEQPMVVTAGDEFRWFGDMDTMTSSVLQNPVFAEDIKGGGSGETMYFPMGEEDESLFADLGELPECSVVFRRGPLEREEERRRCAAAPWCGTTG